MSRFKGAPIQLTKDLANEWAPKGILVNGIAPGWVSTLMIEPMESGPEFSSWMERRVPLSHWTKPEEMAGPVVLLVSEAGSFMTGSIVVDGGLLAVV